MEDVADREGRTVLFVSHNLPAVRSLCKRVILIEKGLKTFDGMCQEALRYYLGNTQNLSASLPQHLILSASQNLHPYFELTSFSLVSEDNSLIDDIEAASNQKIFVCIKGKIKEANPKFNLGFTLENEQGDLLLMSYFTDMPPDQWPPSKSDYPLTLFSEINTSWLSEGKYLVKLIASLHCEKMLILPQYKYVVLFSIKGVRGTSPYNFVSNRNTILSPEIKWNFLISS